LGGMLPKNGRGRGFSFAMARTYLVFGDIEGKLDVSSAPSAPAGAAIMFIN
jgi:hypothetical protein